jgi:kynureninase
LQEGTIYLDGNSLGLLSVDSERAVIEMLDQWKHLAIEAWTDERAGWFDLPERVGALLAPLIGAQNVLEVIVANSTTVNLHQLLATLFQPKGERNRILIDSSAFPSDAHAVQSHLRLRGMNPQRHVKYVFPRADRLLSEEDIIDSLTSDVAMAVLPVVVFTTGQLLNVERITRACRERGVVIAWDCSHSIGAVEHQMSAQDADCAFWCSYKYLNGGPGAVAGLFLNQRHHELRPGLAGWFSSDKQRQFDLSHDITFAGHAGALQIGSPSLLSIAPLLGSVRMIHEAGIAQLRQRSIRLTAHLMRLVRERLAKFGFGYVTPDDPARRGGHVAVTHKHALAISSTLRKLRVIGDFRPPDILRLAPAPLYVNFDDLNAAVDRLEKIMRDDLYRDVLDEQPVVT